MITILSPDEQDLWYMDQALLLAKTGLGVTAPNPSVGCIIVKDNQILGKGVTGNGGRPHAETIALLLCHSQAKGATLYVTLEPCCHRGVTGPCTESIIDAGIVRVVVAVEDPDPRVQGKGIEQLRAAGIEVTVGVREEEARRLQGGFFKVIQQGIPLVTAKVATSLDGKIALSNGVSQWITGASARRYVHQLRYSHDAIMVGSGTILADNPRLTCRLEHSLHPRIRVVLDSLLMTPLEAALFEDCPEAPVWIITTEAKLESDKAKKLKEKGAQLFGVSLQREHRLHLEECLRFLGTQGITRLMVEGGATLFTELWCAKKIDILAWIQAPLLLGNDAYAALGSLHLTQLNDATRLRLYERFLEGEDLISLYEIAV